MGWYDDTAVHRVDEHRFEAAIAAGWDIGGNANGGYLLALVARALTEVTGRPHPVSMTAHYLAPGRVGPVTITVDLLRSGGRHATATATLRDDRDRALLVTVATTTDLALASGPELVDAAPPDLPDPEACLGRPPGLEVGPKSFMHQVDLRLHPDDVAFVQGQSGQARVRGWLRFPIGSEGGEGNGSDGSGADPLGLLVGVDSFPPTVFNTSLPVAWVPTVELTAHLRAVPVPGWLRCAFTTRFITGGYLEEDGEVWDTAGRLIAQSRQLALVPRG